MTAAIGAEELSACLRQYGLQACGSARPLPSGHVGVTTVVPTDQGSLAVKRFGRRFDTVRTLLAAQAHQHAALDGLAPQLRQTPNGQLTTEINGATYMLTEYIHTARPPGLTDFAAALAALHARLDSFRPGGRRTDFLELSDPPAAGLEHLLRQSQGEALREVVNWRLRILAEFGLGAQAVASAPKMWVHGDARPDNVLARRTPEQHLFIDFDQVSRFPRPYEVMRAYVASVSPELPAPLLGSTFRSYLSAYQAVTSIPAAERALMIDLYITVQAAETRTFTTPEGEVRDMSAFARTRHQQLIWIIQHRDLLRTVAEEVWP
ncbi:phosphotransferase [Streptomyces sp. NPDC032198]|uniref:phosphotransferase n=1 Tax=Streptomyces sp. NPDC032198 TaxID=3155127 RepID=UPI0033F2CF4F